jgi:hypothetical protein
MSTVLYYLLKNECIKLFELNLVLRKFHKSKNEMTVLGKKPFLFGGRNSKIHCVFKKESDGDQAAYFCVHSLKVFVRLRIEEDEQRKDSHLAVLMAWASFCFQS